MAYETFSEVLANIIVNDSLNGIDNVLGFKKFDGPLGNLPLFNLLRWFQSIVKTASNPFITLQTDEPGCIVHDVLIQGNYKVFETLFSSVGNTSNKLMTKNRINNYLTSIDNNRSINANLDALSDLIQIIDKIKIIDYFNTVKPNNVIPAFNTLPLSLQGSMIDYKKYATQIISLILANNLYTPESSGIINNETKSLLNNFLASRLLNKNFLNIMPFIQKNINSNNIIKHNKEWLEGLASLPANSNTGISGLTELFQKIDGVLSKFKTIMDSTTNNFSVRDSSGNATNLILDNIFIKDSISRAATFLFDCFDPLNYQVDSTSNSPTIIKVNKKVSLSISTGDSGLSFNFNEKKNQKLNGFLYKIIVFLNYITQKLSGQSSVSYEGIDKAEFQDAKISLTVKGVKFEFPNLIGTNAGIVLSPNPLSYNQRDLFGSNNFKFLSDSSFWIQDEKPKLKGSFNGVIDRESLYSSETDELYYFDSIDNTRKKIPSPSSGNIQFEVCNISKSKDKNTAASDRTISFNAAFDNISNSLTSFFSSLQNSSIPANISDQISSMPSTGTYFRPSTLRNKVSSILGPILTATSKGATAATTQNANSDNNASKNITEFKDLNNAANDCLQIYNLNLNVTKAEASAITGVDALVSSYFGTDVPVKIFPYSVSNNGTANAFDRLINSNLSFYNKRMIIDNSSTTDDEYNKKMDAFLTSIKSIIKLFSNSSLDYRYKLFFVRDENFSKSNNLVSSNVSSFANRLFKLIYKDMAMDTTFDLGGTPFLEYGNNVATTNLKYISNPSKNMVMFPGSFSQRNYTKVPFVPAFSFSTTGNFKYKRENPYLSSDPKFSSIDVIQKISKWGNIDTDTDYIEKFKKAFKEYFNFPLFTFPQTSDPGKVQKKFNETEDLKDYANVTDEWNMENEVKDLINSDKIFSLIHVEDYNTFTKRYERLKRKLVFIDEFLALMIESMRLTDQASTSISTTSYKPNKPTIEIFNESSPDMFYEDPEPVKLQLIEESGDPVLYKNTGLRISNNMSIPLSDIYGYSCAGTMLSGNGFKIYTSKLNLLKNSIATTTSEADTRWTQITQNYSTAIKSHQASDTAAYNKALNNLYTNAVKASIVDEKNRNNQKIDTKSDEFKNMVTTQVNELTPQRKAQILNDNKDNIALQTKLVDSQTRLNKFTQPFSLMMPDFHISSYLNESNSQDNYNYITKSYPSDEDYLDEEDIHIWYPENLMNTFNYYLATKNIFISQNVNDMISKLGTVTGLELSKFIKELTYKLYALNSSKFFNIERAISINNFQKRGGANYIKNIFSFKSKASKNANMLNKKINFETIKGLLGEISKGF